MASTDLIIPSVPAVAIDVTSYGTRPPGASAFALAFNSRLSSAYALVTPAAGPLYSGGIISAALMRGHGAGRTGFWSGLVLCSTYVLGLADADPAHIVLAKLTLPGTLVDAAPGFANVLARSTRTVAIGEWVHLRLEAMLDGSGDNMVLTAYANDLNAHPLDETPIWEPIAGLSQVIDDYPANGGDWGLAFGASGLRRRAFATGLTLTRVGLEPS